MKGTQLWQGTGSPLIEGRSRQAPPFWRAWLGATAVSAACAALVAWPVLGVRGIGLSMGACAIGAALGVAFARRLTWRTTWVLGAACGAAVAGAYLVIASRFWSAALVAVGSRS